MRQIQCKCIGERCRDDIRIIQQVVKLHDPCNPIIIHHFITGQKTLQIYSQSRTYYFFSCQYNYYYFHYCYYYYCLLSLSLRANFFLLYYFFLFSFLPLYLNVLLLSSCYHGSLMSLNYFTINSHFLINFARLNILTPNVSLLIKFLNSSFSSYILHKKL